MTGFHEELLWLFNIFIAMLFSGLVGLEREIAKKPAGLRTHMIVGAFVALVVHLGNVITEYYSGSNMNIEADPIRVIQAIVIGISFIGAGTVLKVKGDNVIKYLTSAASILLSAGIGMGVALEKYILSFGVALLAIGINTLAGLFESKVIYKNGKEKNN